MDQPVLMQPFRGPRVVFRPPPPSDGRESHCLLVCRPESRMEHRCC